jgi:protein SCO1/2
MTRLLGLAPFLVALAAIAGGWISFQADRMIAPSIVVDAHAVGGAFALIDQNGTARSQADFHGRYMLVYFGYTSCPDVCPTTLTVMADAMARLGPAARKIVPVFITVDPARDTPAAMKTYLAAFGPEFVGLTGSDKAIARVAREYHVYYRNVPMPGGGYSVDHSSTIYLMDPDGKFIAHFDETVGPQKLAARLRSYL